MEENVKPLKPSEVVKAKKATIPAAMIQAVNDLIAKNWNGKSATFRQDELLERYFEITGERNERHNREKLFDNNMLDFEDVYRAEGWSVYYDKPAYNEDYEPTFEFKAKSKE